MESFKPDKGRYHQLILLKLKLKHLTFFLFLWFCMKIIFTKQDVRTNDLEFIYLKITESFKTNKLANLSKFS